MTKEAMQFTVFDFLMVANILCRPHLYRTNKTESVTGSFKKTGFGP